MAFRVSMLFGPEASDIVRWLALLISYFAHALIWTGLAALLARRKSVIPAMKNLLWRLALLGPLVTTVVPATLPIGRAWSLETTEIQHSAPAATAIGSQRVTFADRSVMQRAKLIPSGAVAARWIARGSVASRVLALLLVLASGLGLLRFGISVARLLHALAGRKRVRDARLCSRFDALRRRAGVPHARLRESARVSGPLIVGRAEVCIPSGDLAGYSDAEVDAIFAHELAHLERRDGLWFPLVGFVEAVLWMQPFNRWVSTRFRQSAEMACDDRAIELTDAPMALARALTRMADTALAVRGRVLLPAMASHGSAHLERVHRLVVASTSRRNGGSPRVSRLRDRYTVLLCLSALGLAVPSVGVETARARPAPTRPRSVKSNTAAPDGALYDVTMTALTAEAHRLEDQLAADADTTDVFGARDAQPIELRQALRHVLETQAWTEHVYASELQAWEQREGAREPPSPAGQ